MTIERPWARGAMAPGAFEELASKLGGAALQSVLLDVMDERARARTPKDVLSQYARDGLTRPAPVDLRESHAIDGHLLAAASGFEAIELSPVSPLATSSAVALTHQNRVLSALRGTEVVSDPTNVLALECALRLRKDPRAAPLHFVTSQRVLRAQPVPKLPGYTPHFRLFALASGGLETKEHAFTLECVLLHVTTILEALDRLEGHGYAFGRRRVDLLATPERAGLADRIAARIAVETKTRLLEHAYYSGGLRWMVWVTAPDGVSVPLFDGGTFDWLATLTSNRRAVFVASGGGAQLIALRFKAPLAPVDQPGDLG